MVHKVLKATHGRVMHMTDCRNQPFCGVRIKTGQVVMNLSLGDADCLRCRKRLEKGTAISGKLGN